jgi:chromosome segregation ATPase
MQMATIDELEQRVRFVESSLRSEQEISHAVLQQAVRNGAATGVLRTEVNGLRSEINTVVMRLDQLAVDVAVAKAELHSHGTILTVLQQDVAGLRNDATALRRGQEEIHVRLDRVEGRLDRQDAVLTEVNHKLDMLITAIVPPAKSAPA